MAKGGGASRLLARNIRIQRGARAEVGSDTFKVDCLHVGRDIELEKQSTCHSEHSSMVLEMKPATESCSNECGRRDLVSHLEVMGRAHLRIDLRTCGW